MNMEDYLRDMNALSPYERGQPKQFALNAETSAKLGDLYFCSQTVMPCRKISLEVVVRQDAQHDGRPWDSSWVKECEQRLVDEIMADLRGHVVSMVSRINPFGIHRRYHA